MLTAKMRFKKRPIAWLVVDYILIYTSFVDIPFSLSPFMSCYILIETNKGSSDLVICLLDTKKNTYTRFDGFCGFSLLL